MSFRGVSPRNIAEKQNGLRELSKISRCFLRESLRLRIFVRRVNTKKEFFSWADLYFVKSTPLRAFTGSFHHFAVTLHLY